MFVRILVGLVVMEPNTHCTKSMISASGFDVMKSSVSGRSNMFGVPGYLPEVSSIHGLFVSLKIFATSSDLNAQAAAIRTCVFSSGERSATPYVSS